MSTQFFCHYNFQSLSITRISQSSIKEEDNDNILVFEIPEHIALGFLSGEYDISEWSATHHQEENEISTWALTNKVEELSIMDCSLFFKIPIETKAFKDIHIILNKKEELLDVYFKIESLNFSSESKIELFITKENDPSFLLNSLSIDLNELAKIAATFTDPNLKHARQRFKFRELSDISIYTTRIFPQITMEIIPKNDL